MFQKKIYSAILLIVMLSIIALAGCSDSDKSSANNKDEKVTINYFTFSPGTDHEDDLKEMISAFEEQNPNIKVDYEIAPYDDYFTKLQTMIAGGNAPDVFELNYENFVSYASKGALADLSDFIKEDKDFDPSKLNEEAYKAYQYEGKQYGMVESFSNVVTFYNKDLFDKAGVEYPAADWKWQDELAAAEKITNTSENIWGTYAPISFHEFYKVIAQNGGSVFNEDKSKVTINSPENAEALKYMVDKVNKHKVNPSKADLSGQSPEDLFKNGQIGILHTGIWMLDSFKDVPFKWDIALEAGNTEKAHHFFANGLAVSKDSESQNAAYKFARFMSASEEAAKIRIASSWELPAITDEAILKPYLEQTPPESREVVFEALDTLVLPPVIEDWSKMSDLINMELENVVNGKQTPEDALKVMQEELEKLK
ncbi:sugar ABC transporter substrate-binding protein [Bacillus sp. V3-13]|uniref:ABC transporter substrate-binding protein n=1 Tax=Bacillus sp. V3-13 TaxID=2053728 RepID=UPI000C765391|nr:sugar ABC transporter substrate-binding protein [Bacillus sp. V3-13]PLR77374.1 sugar ABC transporter substrate-binding protein [Bacillus sp. V3-13]